MVACRHGIGTNICLPNVNGDEKPGAYKYRAVARAVSRR
jgi:hypothetical protein